MSMKISQLKKSGLSSIKHTTKNLVSKLSNRDGKTVEEIAKELGTSNIDSVKGSLSRLVRNDKSKVKRTYMKIKEGKKTKYVPYYYV